VGDVAVLLVTERIPPGAGSAHHDAEEEPELPVAFHSALSSYPMGGPIDRGYCLRECVAVPWPPSLAVSEFKSETAFSFGPSVVTGLFA
jgi:hypothetical protein